MPDTTHALSERPALLDGPRPHGVPAARPEASWTILPDCPIARGVRVDLLALHPRIGVAILEIDPRWTPEAITLLHASLGQSGFHGTFPGHLPIIHRRLRHEHVPMLRELIAESFLWQAPLSLPEDGDWVAELRAALDSLPRQAATEAAMVLPERTPRLVLELHPTPRPVDPAHLPPIAGEERPRRRFGHAGAAPTPAATSPAVDAAELTRGRLAQTAHPVSTRQRAVLAAGVLGLVALGGLGTLHRSGTPASSRPSLPGATTASSGSVAVVTPGVEAAPTADASDPVSAIGDEPRPAPPEGTAERQPDRSEADNTAPSTYAVAEPVAPALAAPSDEAAPRTPEAEIATPGLNPRAGNSMPEAAPMAGTAAEAAPMADTAVPEAAPAADASSRAASMRDATERLPDLADAIRAIEPDLSPYSPPADPIVAAEAPAITVPLGPPTVPAGLVASAPAPSAPGKAPFLLAAGANPKAPLPRPAIAPAAPTAAPSTPDLPPQGIVKRGKLPPVATALPPPDTSGAAGLLLGDAAPPRPGRRSPAAAEARRQESATALATPHATTRLRRPEPTQR